MGRTSFAQDDMFVLFRVITWIDFGVKIKAIHELTNKHETVILLT